MLCSNHQEEPSHQASDAGVPAHDAVGELIAWEPGEGKVACADVEGDLAVHAHGVHDGAPSFSDHPKW